MHGKSCRWRRLLGGCHLGGGFPGSLAAAAYYQDRCSECSMLLHGTNDTVFGRSSNPASGGLIVLLTRDVEADIAYDRSVCRDRCTDDRGLPPEPASDGRASAVLAGRSQHCLRLGQQGGEAHSINNVKLQTSYDTCRTDLCASIWSLQPGR